MKQATMKIEDALPPKAIRSDVWPDKYTSLLSIQALLRELGEGAEASGELFIRYLIHIAYLEVSDRIREIHAERQAPAAKRSA